MKINVGMMKVKPISRAGGEMTISITDVERTEHENHFRHLGVLNRGWKI